MNFARSRFNNSVCTGDLDFNESFSLYIHHDPIQRKVSVRRAGWTSGSRIPNIDFSGLVRGVFLQGALDTRGYLLPNLPMPTNPGRFFVQQTYGWLKKPPFISSHLPPFIFSHPQNETTVPWDMGFITIHPPFIHHESPYSYWTMAMSRGCALLAQRRPSSPGYKDST